MYIDNCKSTVRFDQIRNYIFLRTGVLLRQYSRSYWKNFHINIPLSLQKKPYYIEFPILTR